MLLLTATVGLAADAPKAPVAPEPQPSWLNAVSVSPYASLTLQDFAGKSRTGAGVDVGLGISKHVSVVAFGEGDDSDGAFVDRAGLGLQATAKLTKSVSLWGRMSGAYNFDGDDGLAEDSWFIRPQFGADLKLLEYEGWYAKLRASWGLNVDLDGHTQQLLTGGLVIGRSF